MPQADREAGSLQVVVFSGGRGSGALLESLFARPGITVSVAINGYDDGASTGEIRRFLGDSLGPSDFRKNASRIARTLNTVDAGVLEQLDDRLPRGISPSDALERLTVLQRRGRIGDCIAAFLDEYSSSSRQFEFGDCSIGNIVFAGAFLRAGRSFNTAVDTYCALLNLPAGVIENVTDGTNGYLIALTDDGRILTTEGEIVDGGAQNRIAGVFLLDRPMSPDEGRRLEAMGRTAASQELLASQTRVDLNPRLAAKVRAADVIVYAPGTQHSSLYPSYLTSGLADTIGSNLHAYKLLVTNIQPDAEIAGSSAVDLVERALHYLNLRATQRLPAPCLITHYLFNEPGRGGDRPYVPLGAVESLEDPRLVRIGSYEDGLTGRHDAERVIAPFIETLTSQRRKPNVALLLSDAQTGNKLTQTLLELVRGGIQAVPVTLAVFYLGSELLDAGFLTRFAVPVHHLADSPAFLKLLRQASYDYVALFESSGMYRGEDFVALASQLSVGRLDAVWGSRRLSVRDIHESYRVRYRRNAVSGVVSYFGSYLLSLTYLLLYGRYVSDTLSGVRAVRTEFALNAGDLESPSVNHRLLSALLRERADLLELPVRFVPISPEKVKRPGVLDGIRALGMIVGGRFLRRKPLATREVDRTTTVGGNMEADV